MGRKEGRMEREGKGGRGKGGRGRWILGKREGGRKRRKLFL